MSANKPEDEPETKTIFSLRTRPIIHRMTYEERDKLLRILFEWEFAERIVNEKLKLKDIQKELLDKHNLNATVVQLKNLTNKWVCEYDTDKNIKRIYRNI